MEHMPENLYIRKNPYNTPSFSPECKMIWHPEESEYFQPVINSFCMFRKCFEAEEGYCSASLSILADSRYQLFINGRYIARGPCRSDPRWQYFDHLDILPELKPGKNVIAVHVLYYGYGTGQYIPTMHMLAVDCRIGYQHRDTVSIVTDNTWKCIFSPAYDRSAPCKRTARPIEVFLLKSIRMDGLRLILTIADGITP